MSSCNYVMTICIPYLSIFQYNDFLAIGCMGSDTLIIPVKSKFGMYMV